MANEIKKLGEFMRAVENEFATFTKGEHHSANSLVGIRAGEIWHDEITEADYTKQWSEHDA